MSVSYPEHLRAITETKSSLRGKSCSFPCRLVANDAGGAVILFIAGKDNRVGGLSLPAGTVTFGYFWPARPYNAYHFMTPSGTTIGHYFNVADRTNISGDQLDWRDLEADVLATPDGAVAILDLHKIPADTDPTLRAHIAATCDDLVKRAASLVAAIETTTDQGFRAVFRRDRPPRDRA